VERVCLVTAGASRLGSAIVRTLHGSGARVAVHYNRSRERAEALAAELEAARAGSTLLLQADLLDTGRLAALVETTVGRFGGLDLLVNNASSFYPSPLADLGLAQWDDLMGSNLKAPLFLCQAALAHLRARRGSIVNIVDIHVDHPFPEHPVYNIAKAGLAQLTRCLAWDLGPEIRVNGVSPGVALTAGEIQGIDQAERRSYEQATALKRIGAPEDIAGAVRFLAFEAPYVTGHILAVDGGQTIL